MDIRKVYAPYSQSGEQVGQTPLEGYVEVNQAVYPAVNTGLINEDGEWVGLKSTDKQFRIDAKHEAIPNGAAVLSPQSDPQYIDMTGFNDLFIGLKVSNGGNFKIDAVMAPDTNAFANLSPINPAVRIQIAGRFDVPASLQTAFYDSAQALTADVWEIFLLQGILAEQKLLQFKITNDSGGESSIQLATMRVL